MKSGWILVGIAAAASALMTFAVYPAPSAGVLLTVFASLPLFLIGLSKGSFFAAATAAAAFAALVPSLGVDAAIYYAAINALPAGLLIWQTERTRGDPTRLAMTLAAMAALPIVVAALYFSSHEGGLRAVITDRLHEVLSALLSSPMFRQPESASDSDLSALVSAMADLFPAMAAGSWAVLIASNAALAQGLLRRFDKAAMATPDIATLRAPRWMAFVLAGTLGLAYLPDGIGYMATNLVPVVLLVFLFAGLGVIHARIRRLSGGPAWLAGVYVLLFVFGWPAALVVLLGMLDVIFDFRRRAGAPPADE